MIVEEENELKHYGILRRSGRYPWGSGGAAAETTRHRDFLTWVQDLKTRLGWSDNQIAESVGITSTEFRQLKTIAKHQQKAAQIGEAQRLKDKGYSGVAIGERMHIPESTVRTLLKPGAEDKANVLTVTSNVLRELVNEHKYVDVGLGVENHVGVSKERKDTAIALLVDEGYQIHYVKERQPGTGKDTYMKVLVQPGTTYSETFKNRGLIRSINKHSEDGGRSYFGIVDPLSINPDRLAIRYGEEGGRAQDGVIYVRPGVEDLSLGGASYAQVRVKIGDTHYLKGMAIYKDDLPAGVDLMFNTNKQRSDDKFDALKDMRDDAGNIDKDNPFGSQIRRQILARRKDGSEYTTSAMNLVYEEGNWNKWSKTISSQVLSKQSPELAKSQLNMTWERRQKDFDEIMSLTNPTIRKKLLEKFADGTDAAAVHLKAARLPRQRWQVILPIDSLPDTEIFAPNFRDGERVALIRYPHGGTFEIPELTVNNRHRVSKKILGQAKDAVGINSKIAEHLSGADFDGDTVLVIPNNSNKITTTRALQQLKGFDPRSTYTPYDGMKTIDGGTYNAAKKRVDYGDRRPSDRKQSEMGDISNLITDMTIKLASHDEISRAVRHSMVVIDAEKHNLNYRQSALDFGIIQLKQKYQGGSRAGASTLVSLAKSPIRVPERSPRRASKGGPIDPVTGRRVYEYSGRSYTNKKGETVPSITRVKRLDDTDDAATLSSGTPMERIYVAHSNKLKELANRARLESTTTPRSSYSPSAAKTYAAEVKTLNASLDLAKRNKPLERQALVLTGAIVRARRESNPNMDTETRKKIEFQALEESRRRTGAEKQRIEITPLEWDAIQAGAISSSKLTSILDNSDMDKIRELATPRTKLLMSVALTNRAETMLASGYTRAQVADQLGVSVTTLDRATGDLDE